MARSLADQKHCSYCDCRVNDDHWYWQKSDKTKDGGYWKCKQQNRDNSKRWRLNNLDRMRLRSHFDQDRKRSREFDLDLDFYRTLIKQPCLYCCTRPADGVDRKDSSIGHVKTNCVPCCAKCNIILGDIPFIAKLELSSGLRNIHAKGLLKNWEVPSKRKS
jgi:hypothetical protein